MKGVDRVRRIRAEWTSLRDHQRRSGLKVGGGEYLRGAIGAMGPDELDEVRRQVAHVSDTVATAARPDPSIAFEVAALSSRLDRLELHAQIASTTAFVEATGGRVDTVVSVVLPTRDRPERLRRAIASVVAQTHPHWELLVVDDATGDPEVEAVVASFGDDRIRLVVGEGRGSAAARNAALSLASGSLVAYADDDNVMQPSWLRAVAWAFDRWPDADVVYGARIYESSNDLIGDGRDVPSVQLEPWDARRLRIDNIIDTGVLAHRAGLDEAWWDESLVTCTDWEIAARLTAQRPPRVLPVVACAYTTDAPNRLSRLDRQAADRQEVMRRIHGTRPLRVLAVNEQYPALTERYIGDEVAALRDNGAEAAFVSHRVGHAGLDEQSVVYRDVETAVRSFEPDVALVHWMTFAEEQADLLATLDVPFAVRAHSFDFSPERAARLLAHPHCVGVWLYPHHAAQVPGAHALPNLVRAVGPAPEVTGPRRLVMSASALLAKKDWEVWTAALEQLPGVERRIVVGATLGHEQLFADLATWTVSLDDPPMLQVNLDAEQVHALMARAAAVVYTIQDDLPFGNPSSIVEAMCAGASAVLPDRPDARAFGGPHSRYYRDADDLARQLRELVAGGPAVEAERAANRAWAEERHLAPALRKQFHAELSEAVAAWHAAAARPRA